jgi:hypothetical protein
MIFKTLAQWRAVHNDFSPSKLETTGPKERSVRGQKILAKLASGFVFLLAKSEF